MCSEVIYMLKKSIGLGIIVFCVLVIGLAGCNVTTSGTTTGGREYFPNTDGYSWSYRTTSTSTPDVYTTRMTFDGTAAVGSVVVQVARTEYTLGTLTNTYESYLRVTDTGVFAYGSSSYPTTEASTLYAFPLEVGNSWTTIYSTCEVLARENVTTPLGTYNNCFKIRSQGSSSSYGDVWLAPNVGMVKMESVSPYAVGTQELTSKNF